MKAGNRSTAKRSMDSGVSILIISVSMVFILAMAGLGIDLASLYVGRNQSQRAADAAALAGAQAFVDNNCATGSTGGGLSQTCMTLATQRAEAVGNANLIAGTSPGITDADISFPNQTSSDPQIQVVAGRGTYDGTDHANPMPTFFMKIFGVSTASVSATATAEAYNPSGSSTIAGSQCVKPWLFPNCDGFNTAVANINCDQSGGTVGSFVNTDGTVARPTNYPNGAIGEPYVIKPGSPGAVAAPGQFYAVYLPTVSSIPTSCPSCATVVNQGGSGSGALYRANIECCNNSTITCGTSLLLNTTLQSTAGNMAGPTVQGVDCLIHQTDSGSGSGKKDCGQDFISGITTSPCQDPGNEQATSLPLLPSIPPTIMPGANNPYDPSGTNPITASNSDSVVIAPIFNGTISSGQNYVTVAGFVQLFIRDVTESGNPKGTTYAYVLGVSGCGTGGTGPSPGGGGSGGSGSGGSVISSTGSYVPIRLIHQ